ncbi:MAG: hypothetical protein ACE5GJ_05345 [Gemmatimonadota bacterium]
MHSRTSALPRVGSLALMGLTAASLLLASAPLAAQNMGEHNPQMQQRMQKMMMKFMELAPAAGYIKAHMNNEHPMDLLGGPVHVAITQKQGGVFVALPDRRRLDEYVFGTPENPRAFGGTPGINGVPPMARESENGHYTTMKTPSPFGDKHMVMPGGTLMVDLTDVTATDAATTKDQIKFKASWKDADGNTYEVRCCGKVLAHGLEFPTFGGVMTNGILHGFTRQGTALMPSEYTYAAFWGMGQVLKNGEVLDAPRLVHGMLTEYVRTEGYKLAKDDEVTPTRRHFHLMVPPMMPDMKTGHFAHKAVKTGLSLPNGMELPFWHVMFENLEISGERK